MKRTNLPLQLARDKLDRIAQSLCGQKVRLLKNEKEIVHLMKIVARRKLTLSGAYVQEAPCSERKLIRSHIVLKSRISTNEIESILNRALKQMSIKKPI